MPHPGMHLSDWPQRCITTRFQMPRTPELIISPGGKQVLANVDVVLEIADASGELSSAERSDQADREQLISAIARSSGLVYLFDPLGSNGRANFTFLMNVLAEVAERTAAGRHAGGSLPHHVAVCVSKFDEISVLRSALALQMIGIDPQDRFRLPRVPNSDAREFLLRLSGMTGLEDTELIVRTLESFFDRDRVKYFASSAIGFYVNPQTDSFNPEDLVNVLPDQSRHTAEIRGSIHPINIMEPILWLCAQMSRNGHDSREWRGIR
jgi:hypothetical protein